MSKDRFTVYKFRPLATDEQMARLTEILRTGRLWCADWKTLNDPMEGMFKSGRERQTIETIIEYKLGYRVCSLAGTWKAPPLWAYYASDFQGVAVEIRLPRLDAPDRLGRSYRQEVISEVEYRSVWSFLDPGDCDPRQAAQRVLLSKHTAWRHEQEVRVLSSGHFFIPEMITRVLFGPRINPSYRSCLLKECDRAGVECAEVRLSGRGLTASRVGPSMHGRHYEPQLV